MSETGEKRSEQSWITAPTGSRRWFWQMRLEHSALFFTPFVMLTVVVNSWNISGVKDPSIYARLVHVVPWLLTTAAVWSFSHALWRIMVNMATSKPFTVKDAKVLRRALIVQSGLGLVILFGSFIIVPLCMILNGIKDDRVHYGDAAYGPLAVSVVIGMLTHAIRVIYKRAHTYYEELEKGV